VSKDTLSSSSSDLGFDLVVSVHNISRLLQHLIYHNPTNIVHEMDIKNNIHNNNNNAHVNENENGEDVNPLVEKSKKAITL